MIIHVFNADVPIHTLPHSENIIKFSKQKCYILLFLTKNEYRKEYESLFSELDFSNYYITEPEDKRLPFTWEFIKFIYHKRLSAIENNYLFKLYQFHRENIIIHGFFNSKLLMIYIALGFFSKINWVCWGSMTRVKFLSITKLKEYFFFYISKYCYRRMKNIFCLLGKDKEELETIYSVKNAIIAPYGHRENSLSYCENHPILYSSNEMGSYKMLIGNSTWVLGDYISLVELIKDFSNRLSLTFMLNYGRDNCSDMIDTLRRKLNEYGFQYDFWNSVVSYDKYIEKMANYDIYVCPAKTQSGLGAINAMFIVGKTVYTTGYNHEWMRECGYHTRDINDLLTRLKSNNNLLLNYDDFLFNRKLWMNITDPEKSVARYENAIYSKDK